MKNQMRQHVIIDGRNQYNPEQMRAAGFEYVGVGRGVKTDAQACGSIPENLYRVSE